jgi:hypothetical protein
MKTHKGSCLCGGVTLEAQGAPLRVIHCHCPSCRKAIGAAFATFVDFNIDKVDISGATLKTYKSSPGVKRQFCGKCGTTISFFGDRWPNEIDICIGVFDAPEKFTPEGHCYMKTALPWAHEMDDLPRAETFSLS